MFSLLLYSSNLLAFDPVILIYGKMVVVQDLKPQY